MFKLITGSYWSFVCQTNWNQILSKMISFRWKIPIQLKTRYQVLSKFCLFKLNFISLGTCEISSIEEIDVSRNYISSLRSDDLKLTSLKKLNLAANRLTYISDQALYGMPLEVLNLADNQLAALPPTVFNKSQQLQVKYSKFQSLETTNFS